jgi:hypothetical protein
VSSTPTHPSPASDALPHGIAPGQGRTGQRVGMVVTSLVIPVLTLLPAVLALAGVPHADVLSILAGAGPMLTVLLLSVTVSTRHPESHGRLLSTRSTFGRRTLDLGELRKVRRLYVLGNGTRDWLLLTDAYGVRLRLDRIGQDYEKLDALVREAVTPEVDVSDNARQRVFGNHRQHRGGCALLLLTYAFSGGVVVLSILLAFLAYAISR